MTKVFDLNNPNAQCTGISSYWLNEGLKANKPLLVWDNNSFAQIPLTHDIGNATADRIVQLRWTPGKTTDVTTQSGTIAPGNIWLALAQFPGGFFYCTMRFNGGSHAMAGHKSGANVYFLEPDSGLWKLTIGSAATVEEIDALFGRFVINTFKIYEIKGRKSGMEGQHQKLPS